MHQPTGTLAHPLGHLLGGALVLAAQVDVERHERRARPHGRGACLAEHMRAVVRQPAALGDVGLEALVLAAPHVGEARPIRCPGGSLVQVDGDRELVRQLRRDITGESDAIVHRHAANRDEGDDVDSTHARVAAALLLHVDQIDSECGAGDRRGTRALR